MTIDEPLTYKQLELGARFLAAEAASEEERGVHLGMANRYALLNRNGSLHGQG